MDLVGRCRLGFAIASIFGSLACSSDESGNGGTGGTASSGAPGNTAGAAPDVGGGAGSPAACWKETLTAKLAPVDLFLMLDASAAMDQPTGSSLSRWAAVSSGLLSFSKDPGSAGIGLGLGLFPIELELPDTCHDDDACGQGAPCIQKVCLNTLLEFDRMVVCETDVDCEDGGSLMPTCRTIGDCSTDPEIFCFTESAASCDGTCTASGICSRFVSCERAEFAVPTVSIGESPAVEAALVSALQQRQPKGETTTAPALSGALEHARAWKQSHPDHEVLSVLVTAGSPTECLGEDVTTSAEAVAELAAIAAEGASNDLRTFVIGVATAAEIAADARESLDSIALAGNTESAFVIDSAMNVTNEVWLAMNRIRGEERGCEFEAPSGDEVDFDKVNLVLATDSATTLIPRVPSETECDADRGGWFYDLEPSTGDPRRILTCPESCKAFKTAAIGAAKLELGCTSEYID